MKEQLITFETAKLAKKKGFDIDGVKYIGSGEHIGKVGSDTSCKLYYLAPTQSLLQKWLRENHKIEIELLLDANYISEGEICGCYRVIVTNKNNYTIGKKVHGATINKDVIYQQEDIGCTSNYEEALEEGLKAALNIVKK